MTIQYQPKPEHKFTYGLWTDGNIGRDPFGEPVRSTQSPVELFYLLAGVGARGLAYEHLDQLTIELLMGVRSSHLKSGIRVNKFTGYSSVSQFQDTRDKVKG